MHKDILPTHTAEDRFLRSIMESGRAIIMRLDRELEEAGLSGVKFWAVAQLIDNQSPLALSELARCMKSGKSNITQLVDRLEADGLARRVPHPDDRRSVLVEVTKEGRERFEEGIAIHRAVARQIMESFTPEEREQLAKYMNRVMESASN